VKSFIRGLSARGEFCLVILVGFGPITFCQLLNLVRSHRVGDASGAGLSNAWLVAGVIGELMILAAILGIGKLRGWSLATFGSRISWRGTGAAIFLFVVTVIAMSGVGVLVNIIHPEHASYAVAGVTVPFILLFSLINPVFEELLEAGYFITSAFPLVAGNQWTIRHFCDGCDIWICLLAMATIVAACRRSRAM
jgi:membrane protease YdiL (CAAX protease family)